MDFDRAILNRHLGHFGDIRQKGVMRREPQMMTSGPSLLSCVTAMRTTFCKRGLFAVFCSLNSTGSWSAATASSSIIDFWRRRCRNGRPIARRSAAIHDPPLHGELAYWRHRNRLPSPQHCSDLSPNRRMRWSLTQRSTRWCPRQWRGKDRQQVLNGVRRDIAACSPCVLP